MKWSFIVQFTRDSYHARCNTCGSNFSVAAGGAIDIVEIDHLSLTENVFWGIWSTGKCISNKATQSTRTIMWLISDVS